MSIYNAIIGCSDQGRHFMKHAHSLNLAHITIKFMFQRGKLLVRVAI